MCRSSTLITIELNVEYWYVEQEKKNVAPKTTNSTHISLWWQLESKFNDYVSDCYNTKNNNLNIGSRL